MNEQPSINGKQIQVNDIVMIPPYKKEYRVGGRHDVIINDVPHRIANFPNRQGSKVEQVKRLQSKLFLVITESEA